MTADLGGAGDRQRLSQLFGPVECMLAVHVLHDELKLGINLIDLVESDNTGMTLAAGHQKVAQDFDFPTKIVARLVPTALLALIILMATGRLRESCRARKTSPIPPPPIHSSIK